MRDGWERGVIVQIQPIYWDHDGASEVFDYFGIVKIGPTRFVGFAGKDCCRDGTHPEHMKPLMPLYRRIRDGAVSIHED